MCAGAGWEQGLRGERQGEGGVVVGGQSVQMDTRVRGRRDARGKGKGGKGRPGQLGIDK